MRRALRSALILSAGLNLVLAGILCRNRAGKPAVQMPGPVRETKATSPAFRPLTNSEPVTTFVTNRFHWRQIESRDYDQFIANLRAVGCPETTLLDIVSADVRKLYIQKTAALPLKVGFWTGGQARAKAERAREQEQRDLAAEKETLLFRLLGPEVELEQDFEHRDELTTEAMIRFLVGPVPERSYPRVAALMQKWEDDGREIERQCGGILLPEDHARLSAVRDRILGELHRVLTPEQFDEFALRMAAVTHDENVLTSVAPTATDWRAIARLGVEVYGPLDRGMFGQTLGEEAETASRDQRFQEGLKQILGENRYRQYQREKDPVFQATAGVIEQNKLPRDVANKVYEIKELLESSLRDTSGSVAPDFKAMRDASRAEVRNLVGEKVYQALLQQGNAWLTNTTTP
jgi:hypothetical protein